MTYVSSVQVDFIIAFLGVTYARGVAAPLNPNYTLVGGIAALLRCIHCRLHTACNCLLCGLGASVLLLSLSTRIRKIESS